MSRIQIADLNSSEFSLLYDVNDAEMLAIVGGGWFKKALKKVANFFKNATYSVSYNSNTGWSGSIRP